MLVGRMVACKMGAAAERSVRSKFVKLAHVCLSSSAVSVGSGISELPLEPTPPSISLGTFLLFFVFFAFSLLLFLKSHPAQQRSAVSYRAVRCLAVWCGDIPCCTVLSISYKPATIRTKYEVQVCTYIPGRMPRMAHPA